MTPTTLNRRTSHIALLGFMIIASFGMTYAFCDRCRELNYTYVMVSLYCASLWVTLWFGHNFLAHYLDGKISWTTAPIRRLSWGLVITVGYTVFILLSLGWLFSAFSGVDLTMNTEAFYSSFVITFVISSFMHGRSFLINWRQAALEAETFRKESAIARYDALKSQLNPHFLFNSLNALTNLVYEDPDMAARTIKQLSEVYRYVLDTRESELVALADEVEFVQSYLFIQKIRFGDNLSVDVALPDTSGQLAPLALQLLVENAINHNIISREQPLRIRIFRDGMRLGVENNLQRKTSPTPTGTGLGLENIRRRYAFLTKDAVAIEESPEKFVVTIPILPVDS